jgi:DNA-directed RNA polymerase subunit RPC12/RpoP
MPPSYHCDGCGATLRAVEELDRQSGTAGRSWACTYCGTTVPAVIAERLSHRSDGSATDRRP